MIKVNVLYFGAVREACDETPREEVEVQNGTDVGNLVDQLQQKYPRLRDHCQRVQMAVNQFIARRPFSAMVMRSPSSRR